MKSTSSSGRLTLNFMPVMLPWYGVGYYLLARAEFAGHGYSRLMYIDAALNRGSGNGASSPRSFDEEAPRVFLHPTDPVAR
jgi:hypothetical protein